MKNIIKNLLLLTGMILISLSAYAQGKGNLRGAITDEAGESLPGAAVLVKGTTIVVASDMNGAYLLQGVPAGEVVIEVRYLGFTTMNETVVIKENETNLKDFVLKESSTMMGEVVVSAIVGGQQRALNQQKMADNIKQVISADQMGRFPDPNVSDALKRLSGVTTDGQNVQLRGTPASFTNININGEQIMGSQESGQRNEAMDVMPSDILASLEVQKTLLPSNDGDAIAGVINMRTATARTLKPSFTIDLGGGYHALTEKPIYNVKGGYSQRFFPSAKNNDGVFGIVANYSFLRINNGYDRLEAEAWEPFALKSKETGEIVEEEVYVPTDVRYRQQSRKSTRNGATLTLDWAPTKNVKFIFSSVYNKRENDTERYRNRFRFRSENKSDYYLMEDGSIGATRVQNIIQISDQQEDITNYNFSLDGEATLGSWTIDGGLFYTKSERDYWADMIGFKTPELRVGKKGIPKDAAIAVMPSISTKYLAMNYLYEPTDGAADAISKYKLYIAEYNHNITGGDSFTARMNASKNYSIGDYMSTLSFGAKGKFMESYGRIVDGTPIYQAANEDGIDGALLSNMLYKEQLNSKFLNNKLTFGPAADLGKSRIAVADAIKNNDLIYDQYRSESAIDAFFYETREDIYSAYMMNKTQIDKLMILAGVRIEHTKVKYKANNVEPLINPDLPASPSGDYNDFTSTRINKSFNYTKFLPNIQFKYNLTDRTIFRLAWTTGYSRPNVTDIVPKRAADTENSRITIGNPDLKPAYANNLDILFEQYLANVGLISGGAFYKHIGDFQYLSEEVYNMPGSLYDGWNLIQNKNGDAAKVYGAEITFNSNLSFLPSFLKNLVFTSNYTYTHSKADPGTILDGSSVEPRGETRLPGQATHTGNAALAYSTKVFTLQASMNYIGKYIVSLGSNENRDIWQDGRWQLDLNGSVKVYKGLTFWAEAVNVLNSERYTYFGNKNRVYNLVYEGLTARGGFTYKF